MCLLASQSKGGTGSSSPTGCEGGSALPWPSWARENNRTFCLGCREAQCSLLHARQTYHGARGVGTSPGFPFSPQMPFSHLIISFPPLYFTSSLSNERQYRSHVLRFDTSYLTSLPLTVRIGNTAAITTEPTSPSGSRERIKAWHTVRTQ